MFRARGIYVGLAARRGGSSGCTADLIEDVLRRVMRESYSSENTKDLKHFVRHCVRWLSSAVASDGTPVREDADTIGLSGADLEQHDWDRAADIVADAGMVILVCQSTLLSKLSANYRLYRKLYSG